MYIVSSFNNNKINGQIVNSIIQVTSKPLKIAICINKNNFTCKLIEKSSKCAISVIGEKFSKKLIGEFGFKCGKNYDKFKELKYKLGKTGSPIILDNTIAFIELNITETMPVGTHVLMIGDVVDADLIEDGNPMTYDYYQNVIKGKVSKLAPTYIEPEKITRKKEDNKMKKYICDVCGYVYDPAIGDPDNGIKPGTEFTDLPKDWVCPICGVGKDSFSEES